MDEVLPGRTSKRDLAGTINPEALAQFKRIRAQFI